MKKYEITVGNLYSGGTKMVSAGEGKAIAAVLLGLLEAASEAASEAEETWANDWETIRSGPEFSTSIGALTVSVRPVFIRAPKPFHPLETP